MENAAEGAFAFDESWKIERVLKEEIWGNSYTQTKENDEINRRHGQVGGFNPPKGTPASLPGVPFFLKVTAATNTYLKQTSESEGVLSIHPSPKTVRPKNFCIYPTLWCSISF